MTNAFRIVSFCTLLFFSANHKITAQGFEPILRSVATSEYQWTGLAISRRDRMFVNFPRWSKETPVSVGEIIDGVVKPFPNDSWNNWSKDVPAKAFVCVQSIAIDDHDALWVLDTGYDLETDSSTNAHLYVFDIGKRKLLKEYAFPNTVVHGNSYLNDFRIDRKKGVVYLTDSGLGGIVVLDLKTAISKRVLGAHPSTLTERSEIVVEGRVRKHPVHSDGIELDRKNDYLYYCALMGENIYRIKTDALLDDRIPEARRGQFVEKFATSGANDGIFFCRDGNLFLSSLELNAISVARPDGTLEEVISGEAIKWPDTFAMDSKGNLYFTISQIHIPRSERGSYKIFRLDAVKQNKRHR